MECIRERNGEAPAGRTAVEILLGEHREVTGVRYRSKESEEDRVAYAPVVFANASPHAVEYMLPAAERERFMTPYRDKPLSISLFSISLGLNRHPAELVVSAYSTIIVSEWMERLSYIKHYAGLLADMPSGRLPVIGVCNYSHIDRGLIDGKYFQMCIAGADRLCNWEDLSDTEHQAKKAAWLDAIIKRLDAKWPGFANAVAQREFATAKTMRNFLNTPEGAINGFAPPTSRSVTYYWDFRQHLRLRSKACGWPLPSRVLAASAVPCGPAALS